MKKNLSDQIRENFLRYFEKKGHEIVRSGPVFSLEDPTLLFTNAGMNQFKDLFLGKSNRSYNKATSSQKCIRAGGKHNDLDNVGHTTRHLTFFEMLGNFSFGDYFKKEAIQMAWEVATEVLSLDQNKIWASVFTEDLESYKLWQKYLPEERIVKMGEKENFWQMGDVGPCGPCSELLFDRGDTFGTATTPLEDPEGERFFEFWNLVFMEFEKKEDGSLDPLPVKSIDTGMGLERIVSLKMQVHDVFQTDILASLIEKLSNIAKVPYKIGSDTAPSFHVIADHIRTLCFAIADGLIPSNTDRGYVLRKILRRSLRYGKNLGLSKPFLGKLVSPLCDLMGHCYPELIDSKERTIEILTGEEESFFKLLQRGGSLMQDVIAASKEKGIISGKAAFTLKDTYGFPIEEIALMAKDHGLKIDYDQYQALEKEAKERSKASHVSAHEHVTKNLYKDFTQKHSPSLFVGYDCPEITTTITGLVCDNCFVDKAVKDQEVTVLLKETPFYAEMGGQVGDQGVIQTKNGSIKIQDTYSPFTGVIAHRGKVTQGSFQTRESVVATIDQKMRGDTERNHTATHLLHWALSHVLGTHIKQAGSYVGPERLRFDFSHHKALSKEEIQQIEQLINEKIWMDLSVKTYEIPFTDAEKDPHIKQFFGDKYGDIVRVVDIDFSKELCGGTHTSSTGRLGLFKITKEASIAAGVRRIEAVTASGAYEVVKQEENLIDAIASKLKTPKSKLLDKMSQLLIHLDEKQAQVSFLENIILQQQAKEIALKKQDHQSFHFICEEIDDPSLIGSLAPLILKQIEPGIVVLGGKTSDSCRIVIAVSPSLPFNAKELIQKISPIIQGGGGGKKEQAQAGGKNPEKLEEALTKLSQLIIS
jgi:alanyl-tRNA synthetase